MLRRLFYKVLEYEKIWHIGIASEENWNEKYAPNKRFDCLVTTISRQGKYKLHFGKLCFLQSWVLNLEHEINLKELKGQSVIYKSSFATIKNKKYILVSWKNSKGVWKISECPFV